MSPARRGGLGRGLGALLPTAPPVGEAAGDALLDVSSDVSPDAPPDIRVEETDGGFGDGGNAFGATLREIAVDAVATNPRQPRTEFDQESLDELAASIREVGLLQPVVVRPLAGGYELVMGERRLRAARLAGLAAVPAIVRETADDEMLRNALLENLHREDLNPLEEAAAYQQLLAEFGATQDELARRLGYSRPHITNTLRLLNLPPAVQRRLAARVLSAAHARVLLGLEEPAAQEALAARIVAEGLSVRAVEELVVMGDAGRLRNRRNRVSGPRPLAELRDVAERLGERLATRVRVHAGRHKGRITIEFADAADLERLISMLAPEQPPDVWSGT